ncbi:MAG: UDP-N-acetylmuramoyl-tripeptide--D-alanyl-D-alanine ligase, partial [Bacilli bacterium]|nr:UDP-N-acetylmuramoyl-tripeptide--D-alanyl-D-alanine ligase [Bacilli bacterium]
LAVITNIGTAHIGNLGSRENILKAKLEILEGLNGPVIINNDNDLLNKWRQEEKHSSDIITIGIENTSDYQATNLKYSKNGSSYSYKDQKIAINVIGKHFIYNSLIALAIGSIYQISLPDILKSLKNIPLEPRRMEVIKTSTSTIIDDTYNASYDSIYYALEVLSSFSGRKIAVLGDILELGDFGEDIHRKIGPLIIQNKIDILVTVGPLANFIHEEALKLGFNSGNAHHFKDNSEAIAFINLIKENTDTILVKASNGMHFSEIVSAIKEEN